MATQTSLVAQQVRIRQWAEQIRNCQNRPKGMDVETWCTQNNLTKANYYYRLRRVRQICLDQMQDTETTAQMCIRDRGRNTFWFWDKNDQKNNNLTQLKYALEFYDDFYTNIISKIFFVEMCIRDRLHIVRILWMH